MLRPADGPDHTLFISYRVSDTGPTATWLFQELAAAYGAERVFLDHERLEGGAVWPEQLEAEAQRASVMLVLIGEGWLRAHEPETFVRRLDQEGDWVRKEIETALGAGSMIVPMLVEGAKPLSRQAFATVPSLAPLADRQTLAFDGRTGRATWSGCTSCLQPTGSCADGWTPAASARPSPAPSPSPPQSPTSPAARRRSPSWRQR
jgi:TIR domain